MYSGSTTEGSLKQLRNSVLETEVDKVYSTLQSFLEVIVFILRKMWKRA